LGDRGARKAGVVAGIVGSADPLEAAVRVLRVSKTFVDANGVRALDTISFHVGRGEFVSIIGPSGCGKSTLLRIVAGLIMPDPGGTVEVFGRLQTAPSNDIGVVFQTHNLLPWLTAEANIRLAAEVQRIDAGEIRERVEAILPVLKLESFRKSYPHQLSGGMRQRAALGQALVLTPPCVVPDNGGGTVTLPPAGCNYLSPSDVHEIINGLPAGTTVQLKDTAPTTDRWNFAAVEIVPRTTVPSVDVNSTR